MAVSVPLFLVFGPILIFLRSFSNYWHLFLLTYLSGVRVSVTVKLNIHLLLLHSTPLPLDVVTALAGPNSLVS
jgi:hypothetical protein